MQDELSKSQIYMAGICSLIVTVGVARFSYTSLLPIMQSETGLTDADGGWLATANYLGYMLGVLMAASLNSPHHKYLLHRLYLVLSVVTSIAMVFSTDLFIWSLLRFVAGICASGGLIIASGLILKWMVSNGYRAELGIHFAGVGIGIVFTALLVESLHSVSANWQHQWLAFAAMAALFSVPAWRWMPQSTAEQASVNSEVKDNPPERQYMVILMLAYFCAGYGYVVSATFVVDIVEGLDSLQGYGQLVFLLIGISAIPAVLLWDLVARKLGYLKTLLLAYSTQIIGILLSTHSESLTMLMFSAVLYGGTMVACVSLVLTMAGRFYPSNPAKFMGKMTLAFGVAQIIAPVCTGYLAQASGNYSQGLYLSAVVMSVGACFLLLLIKWEAGKNSIEIPHAINSGKTIAPS